MEVDGSFTIAELKLQIQFRTSIAPWEQLLRFSHQNLEDRCTLAHYNIKMDSELLLVQPPEVQGSSG